MPLPKAGVQLVAEGASQYFADLQRGDKALAAFGGSARTSAGSVNAFGDAASKNAARVASLSDKLSFQGRQLGILQRSLEATKARYGENSVQAQRQQLAVDRLTASIGHTEDQLRRYQDATDDAGKASGRFREVAVGALREVGGAAVNFAQEALQGFASWIGQALRGAGEYERAMNVLREQSGATDEEMQQVRDTAKALGADLTLPGVSAATAGEEMLELSKGGLALNDAMSAAKGTLQLVAAAETDVTTAANITTGALAAFGLAGDQAVRVADLLTNSANESRIGIVDLGQGFQQAAFRFASAGQGVDDLTAALTILTKVGLSGSDAGTALQNAIGRLQAPTDQAAKLMHNLGINVYDANGNMLPMRDIIAVINRGMSGMTQQERNAALSTIFLSDGMKAMIPLLAAGADGFDEMKAKVNKGGSAARMAQAQMQGLLGSAEGLTSALETLALEGLEPILPLLSALLTSIASAAGSFSGKLSPAVSGAIVFFGDVAGVISDALVPALVAATAAAIAYAIANAQTIGIALALVLQRIILMTQALIANAAAALVATAPLIVLAAAVGGAVLIYQQLGEKVADATTKLLESRQWWNASADTLDRLAASSQDVQDKFAAHRATIEQLRQQIQGEVEDLGKRDAAGLVSDEQRAAELARINQHREALQAVTDATNREIDALLQQQAAAFTASQQTQILGDAIGELPPKIQLTEEELQKLAEEFNKILMEGASALGELATTHATFLNQIAEKQGEHEEAMRILLAEKEQAKTDEQKRQIDLRIEQEQKGYQESLANQAKTYAEQAAAQRQALGEQLLAYIENQRQMGNISDEKAAEIRETTIQHFGVMRDSAAALFGEMAQSVDRFAQDAGASADSVASDWVRIEDRAVSLREKANALKDQYVMEIVADIDKPGANLDDIRKRLADIPRRVETEIVITERRRRVEDTSGTRDLGTLGTRASGGPVAALTPYLVGERGRELFIPKTDGFIVNAGDTQRLIRALAEPARYSPVAPPPAAPTMSQQITNTYAPSYPMTVYTNMTTAAIQQSYALQRALYPA